MMGSPFYYDVSFDHGDIIYHDCMWSGDCTCCIQLVTDKTIPTKLDIEIKPIIAHYTTTTTTTTSSSGNSTNVCPQSILHHVPPVSTAPTTATTSTRSASTSKSTLSRLTSISKSSSAISKHSSNKSAPPTSSSSSTSTSTSTSSSSSSSSTVSSSADNKKLRHREVEKNRHRQLQAMVKTLSERIPGQTNNKETQVQTMKRAARYCVYLRDVLITHSHGQGTLNKDKLEKLYRRSCDNVDLIMSQQ